MPAIYLMSAHSLQQEFVQRNEITHPTQHALHHCVHKEEECPYYNDFTEVCMCDCMQTCVL